MSNEIALIKSVESGLDKRISRYAKAIPQNSELTANSVVIDAKMMVRKNPELMSDQPSLFACIMTAVRLGLPFYGPNARCHIIAYYNKHLKCKAATFQLNYLGAIELACRCGSISKVTSEIVFDDDEFYYELGLEPKLIHKPATNIGQHGKKTMTHVYAVAFSPDGTTQFKVLSVADVEYYRSFSKADEGNFWTNHYGMMAKKTAITRLMKLIPQATSYHKINALDVAASIGVPQIADDKTEELCVYDLDSDDFTVVENQADTADNQMQLLNERLEDE